MKKILLLLLVIIAIAGTGMMIFTACANDANPANTQTDKKDDEDIDETPGEKETKLKSNLPSDLNYNNIELNIWYFTKNSDASEHFLDIKGDLNGDIVDEALYNRNLAVEEQLTVKLNFIDNGVGSSDVGGEIRKVVMAGDTTYDMFNVVQWNSSTLAVENLFLNVRDAKYLDLEQPWWAYKYMKEITIGNKQLYFLCGDVSVDMIRCIASMYYNKQIYENQYGDPDGMYNTVLDDKWTLDNLAGLCTEVYQDLNGDGVENAGDRYGFISNTYNNLDAFIYGSGVRVTTRDSENIPQLTFNNEKTVAFFDKIYKLFFETVGGSAGGNLADNNEIIKNFINDGALVLCGWFYTSEKLRDMKTDYGIIPYPKYDEKQETYLSVVHDIATLVCLPASCAKVDEVCAVLEAMAYYSYYNVTPAYYETALKTKYVRDDISAKIIDLIHDNNMTDIAYVYGSSFNSLGYIIRSMVTAKANDFPSRYAAAESAALKSMQKLIDQYLELGN